MTGKPTDLRADAQRAGAHPASVTRMIESIDVCRSVAALVVQLYHASGFMQVPEHFGYVPVFGVFD